MGEARTANLLGALALGLADEIGAAAERQAAHGGAAPAGLSAIGHAPGLTIERLSRALGLSHPGTVRLVDRLAAGGLVERRPARDGRAVALHLTPAGEQRRAAVLAERRVALEGALATLSGGEQERLAVLLEKLLKGLVRGEAHAGAVCRLCEEAVCADCPVERGLAGAA